MMDAGNGRHRGQKPPATLLDAIVHYKRRIECEINDDDKVLHALKKLRSYPIDGTALEATDVCRTVSNLRTRSGEVGSLSRTMVHDWKKVGGSGGAASKSSSSKVRSKSDRPGQRLDDGDGGQSSPKKIRVRVERDVGPVPSASSSKSNRTGQKVVNVDATASKNGHVAEATPVKIESSKGATLSRRSDVDPTTDKSIAKEGGHAREKSRKPKKEKKGKKPLMDCGGEGFNASMASFEDCLGLNDFKSKSSSANVSSGAVSGSSSGGGASSTSKKTKRKSEVSSSSNKLSTQMLPPPPPPPPPPPNKSKSSNAMPTLLAVDPRELQESSGSSDSLSTSSSSKKPYASHVDILSSLPAIQTDYKPFRFPNPDSPPSKIKRELTESTTFMISPRHTRTQVFSGRRSQFVTEVPTLLKSCIRVLQENVAVLSDLMFAPYEHLKPALLRCSPDRLLYLEEMNPYILDETDELWRHHCQREFKGYDPDEFESWRELYYRVSVARTSRLRSITANISASMAKAVPVRQTKLAFLDCEAKPPRQVARQQARFGTGHLKGDASSAAAVIKLGRTKSAPSSSSTSSGGATSTSKPYSEPMTSSTSTSNGPSQAKAAKKVAPLMQKTLKFMKNRFRR